MGSDTLSPSDIKAQLPIADTDMPKIADNTSKPTFKSLTTFQKAINQQALAIPSTRGDGALGHLILVISAADYLIVSTGATPFVVPTNPGSVPVQIANSTGPQIIETNRAHAIELAEYNLYLNTATILKNIIINNVPEHFIVTLQHPITQYARVTPLQLMEHLWTTYGTITSDDLTTNYDRMTAPWNPPTPIENLFDQLKLGQEYAGEGGEPIDTRQLMRIGYNLIQQTGLFETSCREWRNKPTADKTYATFQIFFTKEDADRKVNSPTSAGAGYANSVQDIVHQELANYIEQYPVQHTDPQQPIAPPPPATPSANAGVTLDDIKKLIQATMTNTPNDRRRRSSQPRSNPPGPLVAQGLDSDGVPVSYCWTHGTTTNLRHTSKSCSRKAEGHKDDATFTNQLGGSTNRCKLRTNNT
jgi:hypothetical protein